MQGRRECKGEIREKKGVSEERGSGNIECEKGEGEVGRVKKKRRV